MSACIFHRIQKGLDAEDKAALNTLLSVAPHITVARELSAAGYPMSEHTVRRHRKNDCACNRVTA
jgi:hypothetical protein